MFSAKRRHSSDISIQPLEICFLLVVPYTCMCSFCIRPSLEFFGWFCPLWTFIGLQYSKDLHWPWPAVQVLQLYATANCIHHSKYLCTGRQWILLEDTVAGNLSSLRDYRILLLAITLLFPMHRWPFSKSFFLLFWNNRLKLILWPPDNPYP